MSTMRKYEIACTKKSWLRERMEKLQDCLKDPEKKTRLSAQECQYCFYVDSRIGGCACTDWKCKECGKEQIAGSTCVPMYCADCALKGGMCRHCGAEINLKTRAPRIIP